MAEAKPSSWRGALLRALLFAGVVVLAVALAQRLDPARVLHALRHADWRLVALAALINVTVNTVARVGRWAALLDALPHEGRGARFGELCVLYFASQAASNLLPARAGEVLRVVQLRRRYAYAVGDLVTVQVVETVVAAVTLGALALVVAPLHATPRSLAAALYTFGAIGLGGAVTLFWLARRAPSLPAPRLPVVAPRAVTWLVGLVRDLLQRLLTSIRRLRAPGVWARSLAWSLLSDLTDVLMVGLVLAAVGVSLPVVHWIVAFVAINLVLLVPAAPAQIGVLEMGAVAALRALGVDEHPALAFALLYHASHVVPPTVIGGLLLLKLDLRRRAADDPPP